MKPELSIVVPFANSAAQAENSLLSLSQAFQANVHEAAYEIIAVEAPSGDVCGEARALACGSNVRYFRLDEGGPWRARALSLGVERSRGQWIGLTFDGAHVFTPRVIEHALLARAFGSRQLIMVPEYVPAAGSHWAGTFAKMRPGANDYGELLACVTFGPANPNGFLTAVLGAACMFMPRASYDSVGGVDASTDMPGGGALNLDLYTRVSRLRGTRLVMLAGEAALRQPHPEVTTASIGEAESSIEGLLSNRAQPLGPEFRAVHREPALFGPIPGPLQRFLTESFDRFQFHVALAKLRSEPVWYEDPREALPESV
jgi:hypothetical protein